MQAAQEIDLANNDLGPLAWVLDELRKSLESASAALRRFVRDTGLARGSDMASVDGGQLRIARTFAIHFRLRSDERRRTEA